MILDSSILYTAWPYLVAIFTMILFFMGFYFYSYYTWGICISKANMNGKTVIVTGCTAGIGKETVKDLAFRGARIIMACRNVDNANRIKGSIIK